MGLEDIEKEVEEGEYESAFREIEEQLDRVEQDFDEAREENPPESLGEKQRKAQKLLTEIHRQIRELNTQVKEATQKDKKF